MGDDKANSKDVDQKVDESTGQAEDATGSAGKQPEAAHAEPGEPGAAASASSKGGSGVDAALDTAALTEALEQAREEIAALQDQVLRSRAEMENTRRRSARDVENAHKFALEKFAGDLLPVVDSLEKAVEAAAAQTAAEGNAIGEGVELSLKLFLDVLEKAGIVRIDPLGEPFDPQLHEAMAMVENPDAEPNSVLDVMQKGYSLNGRLVRAAMVVVSKAPAA